VGPVSNPRHAVRNTISIRPEEQPAEA